MGTTTFSGTVKSNERGLLHSIKWVDVTLYDTTQGSPRVVGTARTSFGGAFSMEVPGEEAQGIYYAAAHWDEGVVLVAIVGPLLQTNIEINELTTVAAAFSMAQFVDGSHVTGSAFALGIAAGMSENLVSPLTGSPSDVMTSPPNADQTNSLRSLRSLANLLAPTVRGEPGAWSTLQALATPPDGSAPADTFRAMVNIARHPAWRVAAIYQQSEVLKVYSPTLAVPPDAWTLCVKVNRTGDDGQRMFGGPANIAWDRRGYAWVANNVFQGTPNSGDFVVVLQPNGKPSDGSGGSPVSPVVGGGLLGPGFGVAIGPDETVWVGSFGWGPSTTFPTAGIVSRFGPRGEILDPDGYLEGTARVQGMAVDARKNVWMASYGTSGVVVYPDGRPENWFSYPAQGATDDPPGQNTFGMALDPGQPGTAWATYGFGLGWPTANPGVVARFAIDEGGGALDCTLSLPNVGAALKGVTVDSHGNAWVASGGDDSVYMVTPDGGITGYTNRGGLCGPWGVAVDGDGDVWVANFGHMGILRDYTNAAVSKLAGVDSPSGLPVGEPISPETGYTLPTAGEPVTLADGSPPYKDGTPCYSPLMRMTSVNIDAAGNLWAVNNWKPRFGTDFEPCEGNPGGDGIVIFVGVARPPVTPA